MNTEEYQIQMKRFDEEVQECDSVQGIDLSRKIIQVPEWNRLSLDEYDPEFVDEFQRVIDDESIPEAENDEQSNEPIVDP